MSFEFRRREESLPLTLQTALERQQKGPGHDPNQPCHIDILHDELLARILLLLPWCERLHNVERVSKRWRRVVIEGGWSDLTVFDSHQWKYSRNLQYNLMLHLLSRCSSRLAELTLRSRFVISVLPKALQSCPNVRHLRLCSMELGASAVDCIRETMGGNLRSLAFENCFKDPETIPALNSLFAACSQLEYLYIREESEGFSWYAFGLRLPPQLKYLALYDGRYRFIQRLLSEENCRALAPNLRGLRLYQPLNSAPFPQLVQLVNLAYLGVAVTKHNGSSLLAALPAMPGLRALELQGVEPGMMDDFPALCTQLEHLSLTISAGSERQELELLRQVGLRLEHLRSLRVYEHRRNLIDCRWLQAVAERGRLEYLHVFVRVDESTREPLGVWPLPLEIVRNCKDLYALYIPECYAIRPEAARPDYEGLISAAKKVETEWMKYNDKRTTAPLPTIRIGGMLEPTAESLTSYRRIEWVGLWHRDTPESSILRRYQYGMLRAGAPTWASPHLEAEEDQTHPSIFRA